MDVHVLPASDAAHLVPLTLQVQAVHSAQQPSRYTVDPDPQAVAAFLSGWLVQEHVTALVTGPTHAPSGYLIYEIERRGPSVLKRAETRAMLHHICVDSAHRRQGLGRALIAAFKAREDVRAADRLRTSYASFNAASAALMADAGFAPEVVFAGAEGSPDER